MIQRPNHSLSEFGAHARQLLGRVVTEAEVGVGSMITIQVEQAAPATLVNRVWVRLTEWALTRGSNEVLASDLSNDDFEKRKNRVADLIGRTVLNIHLFEDGEFHIDFSGDYRLEIWSNTEAYGQGANLVSLFATGGHVATLTVS